jgi:hypothetical protein
MYILLQSILVVSTFMYGEYILLMIYRVMANGWNIYSVYFHFTAVCLIK